MQRSDSRSLSAQCVAPAHCAVLLAERRGAVMSNCDGSLASLEQKNVGHVIKQTPREADRASERLHGYKALKPTPACTF